MNPDYILLGAAKLNGSTPQVYLRYVFERIADHRINRIEGLLPWSVAAQPRAGASRLHLRSIYRMDNPLEMCAAIL